MKKINFLVLAFILGVFIAHGQNEKNEKSYFEKNKDLGGECIIEKSAFSVENEIVTKTFEIDVPEEGEYYLSAWLMGAKTNKGFLKYGVKINKKEIKEKIKPLKSNWQAVKLKNQDSKELKKIKLAKGINTISFSSPAPEVPVIEFVRIAKTKEKAAISEEKYKNYIKNIKKEIKEREENPVVIKDSLLSKLSLKTLSYEYFYKLDINFDYTTYKFYYFTAGNQMFFTSYASDKYDHILEVFSTNKSENYTWVSKSNQSGLTSINVTIPYTGYYCIRVRAYRQTTHGLVDLNINGQYYFENCAVSGSGFRCSHSSTSEYNYFTCNLTGDSRIWMEKGGSVPGKIIGHNDDYYGGGDFRWRLASRVKKAFSTSVGATLISSYGSYNPTGTCDVYMKCSNSSIMSYFPNLEANDAIRSAPASSTYNCISWSGGVTDDWFWPPTDYGETWYASDPLTAFDNYYGNKKTYTGYGSYLRYGGAQTYKRQAGTNGPVALWNNPNYPYSDGYTHGSVKKPANNHLHGYDWESKPGGLMRTFHPRDALEAFDTYDYGSIKYYYNYFVIKPKPILPAMSLKQSIEAGLTVPQVIVFDNNEKLKIQKMKEKISSNDLNEFENKYNKWKSTWSDVKVSKHSNPRVYAESKEYDEIMKFCSKKSKDIWGLLFDKFNEGDYFVRNLLEDITFPEYGFLIDSVRLEREQNLYTKNGKFIAPSSTASWKKYIKKLLIYYNGSDFKKGNSISSNNINNSNSFEIKTFPVPCSENVTFSFSINILGDVYLRIYDMKGKVVYSNLNKDYPAGTFCHTWNIPEDIKTGLYFYSIYVNKSLSGGNLIIK